MINTVPSLGPIGGAALAAHPDVDKVAFTGSTITGRKIMEAAAKSNLKKVAWFFMFSLSFDNKRASSHRSLWSWGGSLPISCSNLPT